MINKRTARLLMMTAVTAAVAVPLVGQVVKQQHQKTPSANVAPNTDAARTAAGDPNLDAILKDAPAAAPASQPAVDPAKVVLTIGDQKVTAGEFQSLLSDLPPQAQQQVLSRPDGKRRLADELVNFKLMSEEAKRRKLDESPKVKLQFEQVLSQALMAKVAEDTAADQKFYNDHKSDFEQVKARHILIATTDSPVPAAKKLSDADAKAKAQDIKKRLDKGEDFAKIAKAESDDTQSGAEGGSLGTVSRGQMVPPFEEATFALKNGQISEPVKTQFGYHIIQAMDRTAPPFTEVRRQVAQRRVEGLIEDLKKGEKPVFDDSYFGPAPATKPSAQASSDGGKGA